VPFFEKILKIWEFTQKIFKKWHLSINVSFIISISAIFLPPLHHHHHHHHHNLIQLRYTENGTYRYLSPQNSDKCHFLYIDKCHFLCKFTNFLKKIKKMALIDIMPMIFPLILATCLYVGIHRGYYRPYRPHYWDAA